ncbi:MULTISPECIES: hypothetical protein [unclassified Streptomyces]|uniref:hypothetical protein n=1 Tax=unclassified Streptomyces TaxID=2593676 RepID=UPI00380EC0A1
MTVLVCGTTAGLAVAGRALGLWAPALGVALLGATAVVVRRRRRRPARHRRGHYSPAELAELDLPGLVEAVARMLRRDGWRVLPPAAHDTPHLAARDRRGRLLDVAFRPVAEPLPDEDDACACRTRWRSAPHVRLVVHRGAFTARDHAWATRRPTTHLVDGPRLRAWATGTALTDLVALDGPPGTPPGSGA